MGFRVIDAHGGLKTSYLAQASEVTITTTGNIDNLDFSNASTIRMNNASLATIRGLKAGIAGQRVVVVSVGAGQVDLAHQNTGSTAANRLLNFATSLSASLTAGAGTALYEYDGTTLRWRLVSHVQGAAIAIAGPSFTANLGGTWSGTLTTYAYLLEGRFITMFVAIDTCTVTGAPTVLSLSVPFTIATQNAGYLQINNAGSLIAGILLTLTGTPTVLDFLTITETAFTASAGGTSVAGQIRFPIT